MEKLLEMKEICKSFGTNNVLKNVQFDLFAGEVHALIGENGAGKSTLMKILMGMYKKDSGSLSVLGSDEAYTNPDQALKAGVAMIHQELNPIPDMSVAENIFLGKEKRKWIFTSKKEQGKESKRYLDMLGIDLEPSVLMRELSVSEMQMVEIAKALSYGARIIIMDEPTSAITEAEVEKLFQNIKMLKEQGTGIIYISHKMDEIFEICDEISVLRDGNLVMTKSTEDTDMNELITAMVGRSLENRFPEVDNTPGDVVLSVQHLSTKFEPYLKDVSFDVRKGEIFGLYGLVGAGRTELMETIFGVRTRAAGRVYFNNHLMNFESAKDAMEHGFAMITEERKANGLFLKGDLTFNTTIANLKQYKSGIALSDSKMEKATAEEIKTMRTKCMGPNDMISNLSGGNQQKVIFGKWLEREPQVFMMDEPTRGIDVGAKYEIYELIINMAKQGRTIIVVSSEMPEILGITNRIGVMSNGYLSGIVNTKETNQEELLRLSAKYL